MATLTYTNLETRLANRLRIPTSNTTEMTKLQAVLNEVYRDVAMMYDWWWLRQREIVNTADDITTGTVSVTRASTAITFSSAPSPSVAGRVLLVPAETLDSGARWRIATHTAGATGAVLDATYTGATNTAAGYRVYQDTYDLSANVGEVLWVLRAGFSHPLTAIGPEEMYALKAFDTTTGKPQTFTVDDFATTGDSTTVRRLIVHPYPDNIYRLEVHFKRTLNTEVSGTTRFLLPDEVIQVLLYGALSRCYPVFLNDTERGTYFQGLFNDMVRVLIAKHHERTGDRPQMVPRDQYRQFYSRRRITAGNADLGSYFDRWPVSR